MVQSRKRVICYSGHNLAHVGLGRGRFLGGHPGFPSIQGFRELPATPKGRDGRKRKEVLPSLSFPLILSRLMLSDGQSPHQRMQPSNIGRFPKSDYRKSITISREIY